MNLDAGTQSVEEFVEALIALISHLNEEIGVRDERIGKYEAEREALYERLVAVERARKGQSPEGHLN